MMSPRFWLGWVASILVTMIGVALAQEDPTSDAPAQLHVPGLENLHRVSPRLYSGGQPEGDSALGALAELGVRTIITVDGATPDVESAREHGLRYVHVPVGYDGIDPEEARSIVRAATTLPGPVYIHCHHGKHRGPTAAALCLITLEGWSAERATAWMKEAGTSPDYGGLYATVAAFQAPNLTELANDPKPLPERAEVPDLVQAMVDVDSTFERLRSIQAAGFRPPARQPDLDPPHEALMLAEHYREAARLESSRALGAEFLSRMAEAEHHASSLRGALLALKSRPAAIGDLVPVTAAFSAVGRDCKTCHAAFRDHPQAREHREGS